MTMLFGKVTIPNTSGDMTVKAIPVVSVGGATAGSIDIPNDPNIYTLTSYTTFTSMIGIAYIYAKPSADPSDDSTWPTAQEVVDNGTPSFPPKTVDGELVMYPLPFYMQDIAGSPQPDARLYFVAKADGAGDLRVGN